jgi:hypothetical protein
MLKAKFDATIDLALALLAVSGFSPACVAFQELPRDREARDEK